MGVEEGQLCVAGSVGLGWSRTSHNSYRINPFLVNFDCVHSVCCQSSPVVAIFVNTEDTLTPHMVYVAALKFACLSCAQSDILSSSVSYCFGRLSQ